MKLTNNTRLLFIGDSITDAGRDESGEETLWNRQQGFGSGYVNLVNALIQTKHPETSIRIFNRGVGGNTVLDLKNRWGSDVTDWKPNWLSVMIGINDVWRQFDTPLRKETHISPERFNETLDGLLQETRPHLDGLILISPYIIEPNRLDPMRKMMDHYGTIVEMLAKKHDAHFVDAQAAMDRLTINSHPYSLAWDRIHPSTVGHMAIANALMESIEIGQ